MYDRMQTLSQDDLTRIHNASVRILNETGVAFNDPEAIEIFNNNGFKTEGKTVFFTEADVAKALETTPARFKVTARNPEKSVFIGEDDWVFVPTYGSPFICTRTGEQRPGTIQDYDNICKLVQTSEHINMNGFKNVEPGDVPTETAYLDMLFSNIILCDKPYMGSTDTRQAARDSIEMAGIIFGGKEKLKEMPVMIGLINPLSPLQFADEMAGSIIEYARYRQPVVILNMIMAGTSGPIRLPGLFALMNAEILAGLVLSQLVGPGTPVIYGTTSCPTNMKTGAASIGSPETYIINSATTQLARFYNLPCRTGGSLTDALVPDAQALAEGALTLSTSVRNGANFILHSCGMMGTYIGTCLEKWLIDEELCGMVRRMLTPVEISDEEINVDAIKNVGIGGTYLMDPTTLQCCRTAFYENNLYSKQEHSRWLNAGGKRIDEVASDMLVQRLAAYEKPAIDPDMETALAEFVSRRKQQV
ncbi:trimethylamine methyltransferase [Desulfonema ishimotonii]|uniref:Methyltransferase n=1 Tax=Desulfonema ishimotonii TaxID=45657 RepID=A0A401FWU2_9BACT|nr:trimethylamine methyltransferase family protein [Desulfonema ishimotonii]GBC61413.1 trimethylamine methyltransferase [Desulfonema ishimotonii]